MLHVLNGDAIRDAFLAARLPGDATVWREMLMEGPVPNGLASAADWDARAAELERRFAIPRARHAEGLADVRARLTALSPGEEVVLWFEEDWFCEANLLHLLVALERQPRVSLVCPETPLGKHAPDAFDSLFDARERVPPAKRALARRAWDAYASADPRALQALADATPAAWPLLARGIRAHLARFPDSPTGLDAVERAALEALAPGPLAFRDLFRLVAADVSVAPLGIGDAQVAQALFDLAHVPHPLVAAAREEGVELAREGFPSWTLAITRTGGDVLRGRRDHVALNGCDRWLGGVRLEGHDVWRWDETRGALVPPAGPSAR